MILLNIKSVVDTEQAGFLSAEEDHENRPYLTSNG